MTDEERDELTRKALPLLDPVMAEWKKLGVPPSGAIAFLLNQAAYIALVDAGLSLERLIAITLRCYGTLVERDSRIVAPTPKERES